MQLKIFTIILILLFSLPANAQEVISGKVEKVTDADTIKLEGENIRLKGIDAPELKQECFNKKTEKRWPCGYVARKKLREMIGENVVTCHKVAEGKYQRFIGQCFVSTEKGKIDISETLVSTGWALAYESYSLRYVANEWMARLTGSGIWSSKFVKPWTWRKQRKSKK